MPVNPYEGLQQAAWGGRPLTSKTNEQLTDNFGNIRELGRSSLHQQSRATGGNIGAAASINQGHRSKGSAPAWTDKKLVAPTARGSGNNAMAQLSGPNYGNQKVTAPSSGAASAGRRGGAFGAGHGKGGGSGTTIGGDVNINTGTFTGIQGAGGNVSGENNQGGVGNVSGENNRGGISNDNSVRGLPATPRRGGGGRTKTPTKPTATPAGPTPTTTPGAVGAGPTPKGLGPGTPEPTTPVKPMTPGSPDRTRTPPADTPSPDTRPRSTDSLTPPPLPDRTRTKVTDATVPTATAGPVGGKSNFILNTDKSPVKGGYAPTPKYGNYADAKKVATDKQGARGLSDKPALDKSGGPYVTNTDKSGTGTPVFGGREAAVSAAAGKKEARDSKSTTRGFNPATAPAEPTNPSGRKKATPGKRTLEPVGDGQIGPRTNIDGSEDKKQYTTGTGKSPTGGGKGVTPSLIQPAGPKGAIKAAATKKVTDAVAKPPTNASAPKARTKKKKATTEE